MADNDNVTQDISAPVETQEPVQQVTQSDAAPQPAQESQQVPKTFKDKTNLLRSAGASEQQINEYTVNAGAKLLAAGATQEQVNQYIGNTLPDMLGVQKLVKDNLEEHTAANENEEGEGKQPKTLLEAMNIGWGSGVTGLATRQELPEQLTGNESWYTRAASSTAQMASDFPAMAAGFAIGGGAGAEAGPGAVVTGMAGAFALPAALRQVYTDSISKGEFNNFGEFMERAIPIAAETAKSYVTGAVTGSAGVVAAPAGVLAKIGAETAAMTTTASALNGVIPTARDFQDNAIVMFGMHGVTNGVGYLQNIYKDTGVPPIKVMEDVKSNPEIAEDVKNGVVPDAYKEKAPVEPQNHYDMVKQALSEGKDVPKEVLADYPDLVAKTSEAPKTQEPTTKDSTDIMLNNLRTGESPTFDLGEQKGSQFKDYTKPDEAIKPYIEGVTQELNDAFKGEKIFNEPEEGQGGSPEVSGFKGNFPEWFQNLNKNGESISRDYVNSVVDKMNEGKPLGVKEARIAEAIHGEAVAKFEENARGFKQHLDEMGLDVKDMSNDEIKEVLKETEGYEGHEDKLYQKESVNKIDSPEFKKWFGDSKVINEEGEPLVVYHGTNNDFNAFDTNIGWSPGSWFTTDPSKIEKFGNKTIPVYLSIENPATLADLALARQEVAKGFESNDRREFNKLVAANLEEKGFDGLHSKNSNGAGGKEVFAIFKPEQAKSIHNEGSFDKNNSNILYQNEISSKFNQEELDRNDAELRKLDYKGMLGWLKEKAPDEYHKTLADAILKKAEELEKNGSKFTFEVVEKGQQLTGGAKGKSVLKNAPLGEYTQNDILLNGSHSGERAGTNYETVLHEALHSVTQAEIDNAPKSPAVKALRDLHNEVIKEFNSRVKAGNLTDFEKEIYGRGNNALKSPDELLAWGLSSKDAQEWLASVKVSPKETLFTKFVDVFRKLFNLPKDTALERVISISDELLHSDLSESIKEANENNLSLGKQENTTEYPNWSLQKGMTPVFVDGDVALYKAKSMAGKDIYVPGKKINGKGNIANVSIDSYSGKEFTPEEMKVLKDKAAELSSVKESNLKNDKNNSAEEISGETTSETTEGKQPWQMTREDYESQQRQSKLSTEGATNSINPLNQILNPVNISEGSRDMATALRQAKGQQAQATAIIQDSLQKYSKEITALSDKDKLSFIDYMENRTSGAKIPDAKLQPVANLIKNIYAQMAAKVQEVFPDVGLRQDYFTHQFKDSAQAAKFFGNWVAKQGSERNLKERTFPTLKEAMDAGLEPKTTNPIETVMTYVSNMNNLITAYKGVELAQEAGIADYFKRGQQPEGWVPLNGNLAEKGSKVLYAPEDAARVYNNDISEKITGSAGNIIDMIQRGNNFASKLVLGLSGYHFTATTMASMASDVARSLTSSEGMAGKAADALSAVTPLKNTLQGGKFIDAYLGKEQLPPGLQQALDLAVKNNTINIKQQDYWKAGPAKDYIDVFKNGSAKAEIKTALQRILQKPVSGTVKVLANEVGRTMDTISKPLFDVYIPRIKISANINELHDWLQNHPDATTEEQDRAAQDIGNSIDNRFGEMMRDNLFWHQITRQTLQTALLSYSWVTGGVRMLGGVKDIGSAILGKEGLTSNARYLLGMAATYAAVNGVRTYLGTGQAPNDWKDFIYPRTGGRTPQGKEEREILPSHIGQYTSYLHEGIGALQNEVNPGLKLLGHLITNQDFRGLPITNENNSWFKEQRWDDYVKYVLHEETPIVIKNFLDGNKKGSAITDVEKGLGARQAPRFVTDPEGYKNMMQHVNDREFSKKKKADRKAAAQFE